MVLKTQVMLSFGEIEFFIARLRLSSENHHLGTGGALEALLGLSPACAGRLVQSNLSAVRILKLKKLYA